jgi:hypothetical protein
LAFLNALYPGAEAFIELQKEGKVEMDEEYFYNLTSYTVLRHSRSYSDHIGDKALTMYRLGGVIMFYSISCFLRPIRFYKTIRNLMTGKEESRLDAALRGIVDRFFKKSSELSN